MRQILALKRTKLEDYCRLVSVRCLLCLCNRRRRKMEGNLEMKWGGGWFLVAVLCFCVCIQISALGIGFLSVLLLDLTDLSPELLSDLALLLSLRWLMLPSWGRWLEGWGKLLDWFFEWMLSGLSDCYTCIGFALDAVGSVWIGENVCFVDGFWASQSWGFKYGNFVCGFREFFLKCIYSPC